MRSLLTHISHSKIVYKTRAATITTVLLLLFSVEVRATNTAISSGAWETGSNWSLGVAPLSTDNVNIPAGISMSVKISGDVCSNLNIDSTGSIMVIAGAGLSIGGNCSNSGSFTSALGSTLTFNGTSTSVISGGGTYLLTGTVVLNMASKTTFLDIQDANFIAGINSGGKYFVNFKKGTWKMNNSGTLNDCYNVGSTNAITIPFDVIIESDAGTMNLGRNAPTGNATLSGELYLNGGTVNLQLGQSFNSGQDFQYHVNGGTPQLYMSSGNLNIGAGFNASLPGDFIDFHMTGGTLIATLNGYSDWITFQLADVLGGKTYMSGGTIILQDATNANIEDLDMGGANVAATQYSVTGGTVQLGYINTQLSSSFFGINAEPATNYPNIDFEAGVPKYVSAFTGGNINMLSLYVNPKMTFDATGFTNVNIMGSNGSFALDDEGGFIRGTSTVIFSGSVNQLIQSSSLAVDTFYNLTISNTSGNVTLGVATTVVNQITLNSGLLDASAYSLSLPAGNIGIKNASSGSYIVTGNGVTAPGILTIKNIPSGTSTVFPIGTATAYLPFSLNPGINTGNSYSAFVFTGVTTNALANGTVFNAATLSKMLNAEWNITRIAGSGNSTVSLSWPAGSSLAGSVFQGYGLNIGISQYTAGSWQTGTGSGNSAAQSAVSTFGSFSQFSVVGNGVVLSLSFVDFDARLMNDQEVLLNWLISDQEMNDTIEIQKSLDGVNWNTIGKMGNDNTLFSKTTRSMTDANPQPGVNYYRLVLKNINGGNNLSSIKTVILPVTSKMIIYPNPARNFINISINQQHTPYSIRMLSSDGKIMWLSNKLFSGNSIRSINISSFSPGTYLIQCINDKSFVQSLPFVILH